MIPFFVGYALLVWFLTARYRRTIYAAAVIGAGVGVLLFLAYLHTLLGRADPELARQGLQILLYPYTAMVGAMAAFISVMPRSHPPGICPDCGYDLNGLGHPVDRCPECGRPADPPGPRYRPSGIERMDLRASDIERPKLSATDPAERGPADQDDTRDHAQQHPADR